MEYKNLNEKKINENDGKTKYLNDEQLFKNLPKLIRPQVLADELGLSIKTIYDWKYRGKTRNIPEKLFLKICGRLYVRTDVLNHWLLENSH